MKRLLIALAALSLNSAAFAYCEHRCTTDCNKDHTHCETRCEDSGTSCQGQH